MHKGNMNNSNMNDGNLHQSKYVTSQGLSGAAALKILPEETIQRRNKPSDR